MSAPNYEQAFVSRPDVHAAWRSLVGAVRADMSPRRYELVTLAAARRLRSSYCSLAHGQILVEDLGVAAADVRAAAQGEPPAGFSEQERAVMAFADQVAADATAVTSADHERLRALGLSEDEILDVVCAAAMRCFFSKALDALCVQPDAHFAELDADLRDALVVGRPIEGTPAGGA
jgi:uncharacterized peroxidase-related enzyme